MKVTHTDTTFTITGKYWEGTYPLADFPKWLTFYRKMHDDFPKGRDKYAFIVNELEKLPGAPG